MTVTELVKRILTSCGYECLNKADGYWWHSVTNIPGLFESELLTSLDACFEVFEKDAPDGYWEQLYNDLLGIAIGVTVGNTENCSYTVTFNMMQSAWTAVAKATAHQRCLAFAQFKGLVKEGEL